MTTIRILAASLAFIGIMVAALFIIATSGGF